ncbi:MAG: hypothetical protein OEY14_18185 [Myxococcales bacterium]|nr:hypothetical protein [Myxococcales bacterium]
MKLIGFIVFLCGITLSSWYAARALSEEEIRESAGIPPLEEIQPMDRLTAWGAEAGMPFLAGLSLIIVGGVVARRGGKRRRKPRPSEDRRFGSSEASEELEPEASPLAMLRVMAARIEGLPAGSAQEHRERLLEVLDDLLEEKIPELLEHREEMIEELGLGAFAGMIGSFAAMERNVARAWSAITDEVYGEVPPCLERAALSLGEAVTIYTDTLAGAPEP